MATTLAQLMTDAKDRADLLNNAIVADPTWRRWINQATENLYRLLTVKDPARFYKAAPFTLAGGTGGNTVALASDFRQLLPGGVTKDPGSQSMRRSLRRFNFAERDAQGRLPAWGTVRELAYDIQAGNIVIEPAVVSAGNYAYYYVAGPVPWLTDGSQDNTAIASVFEPYVDFIGTHTAIKGLTKDESDTADLRADLALIVESIQAEFNSVSDPSTITDVYATGGGIWP
jgi:hypothetical protein